MYFILSLLYFPNKISHFGSILPIVRTPRTPVCSESSIKNAIPVFDSKSYEIDFSRHKWKKVLYCTVDSPGWYKNGQYIKLLLCELKSSNPSSLPGSDNSLDFALSYGFWIEYAPETVSRSPFIRKSKKNTEA